MPRRRLGPHSVHLMCTHFRSPGESAGLAPHLECSVRQTPVLDGPRPTDRFPRGDGMGGPVTERSVESGQDDLPLCHSEATRGIQTKPMFVQSSPEHEEHPNHRERSDPIQKKQTHATKTSRDAKRRSLATKTRSGPAGTMRATLPGTYQEDKAQSAQAKDRCLCKGKQARCLLHNPILSISGPFGIRAYFGE